MTVFRVKHQKNYVVINKTALEEPNLSFKAKGLWSYCMSRPDDWEFHISHLKTVSKDGEDAIYSAIKELINLGYCERAQPIKEKDPKTGKWGFQKMDYVIHETPIKKNNTQPENPDADFQDAENPALLSKECLPKNEKEPTVCSSPTGEPEKKEEKKEEKIFEHIKVKGFEGKEESFSIDDLFRYSVLQKKNWTSQEITDCWKILSEYKNPIRDIYRFVDGTIAKKRNIKKADSWNRKTQQEPKKATSNSAASSSQTKSSRTYLDEDTVARIFDL